MTPQNSQPHAVSNHAITSTGAQTDTRHNHPAQPLSSPFLIFMTALLIALGFLLGRWGAPTPTVFVQTPAPEYELIHAPSGWFELYRHGNLIAEFTATDLCIDGVADPPRQKNLQSGR